MKWTRCEFNCKFTAAAAAAQTVAQGLPITAHQIAELRAALWKDPNYADIHNKVHQYPHNG